jgi:Uma2 family endonuclease
MGAVLDQREAEKIIEERRQRGARTGEEVWDGVIHIMPNPNNEHDQLAVFFVTVFNLLFGLGKPNRVQAAPNISDRAAGWTENFRNPDMAMFLADTAAEDEGTHWNGGPDFLLEVLSPKDKAREKLPFYAKIGTHEVLILDRDPWQLELYQLKRGKLKLVGKAGPGDAELLSSVVPMAFSLVPNGERPKVVLRHPESGQTWSFPS